MRCSVHLRTAHALAALRAACEARRPIVVFANRFDSPDDGVAQLHSVGTLALVRRAGEGRCCGRLVADLEGIARVRVACFTRLEPYREASCALLSSASAEIDGHRLALQVRTVAGRIHGHFQRCVHVSEAAARLVESSTPEEVLGAVGGLLFHLQTFQRQQILELEPLSARLEAVLFELQERLARSTPSKLLH